MRLLDTSGKQIWEFKAGGKINSVCLADLDGDGKAEVIAGSDDRCCYVLNADGKQEVIFGAANMNIHACSSTGELLWRFKQYGVCTSLVAADLTGDGKSEVIGGPAKITCYSNCLVLDEAGKLLSKFANDGWASALTAICTADLDGNGATRSLEGAARHRRLGERVCVRVDRRRQGGVAHQPVGQRAPGGRARSGRGWRR